MVINIKIGASGFCGVDSRDIIEKESVFDKGIFGHFGFVLGIQSFQNTMIFPKSVINGSNVIFGISV